jgi:hypothetical protein
MSTRYNTPISTEITPVMIATQRPRLSFVSWLMAAGSWFALALNQLGQVHQVAGLGVGIAQDGLEVVPALVPGPRQHQLFSQEHLPGALTPFLGIGRIATGWGEGQQMQGATAKHQIRIADQQGLQMAAARNGPIEDRLDAR